MLEKSDPPVTGKKSNVFWRETAAFLRDNPSEWYVIGEWSAGVASQIRRGAYTAFIPEDISKEKRAEYMKYSWEFHSQMTGDKNSRGLRTRAVLRGRYIGE